MVGVVIIFFIIGVILIGICMMKFIIFINCNTQNTSSASQLPRRKYDDSKKGGKIKVSLTSRNHVRVFK
jgi:hypothetical protein